MRLSLIVKVKEMGDGGNNIRAISQSMFSISMYLSTLTNDTHRFKNHCDMTHISLNNKN